MPSLNEDILFDIVHEIRKSDERNDLLTKFMLSGKEPFEAALKYFSRFDWVDFHDHFIETGNSKGEAYFGFDFDYPLLQPILKALRKKVRWIDVSTQEDVKCHAILEKLITKNTKVMSVYDYLPDKLMDLLQECKLDLLKTHVCDYEKGGKCPPEKLASRIYSIFMISSSLHHLCIEFNCFLAGLSNDQIFDKVEKLKIEMCDSFEEIKEADVKKFAEKLIKCFPNLKNIEATFDVGVHELEERLKWKNIIQPKLFEGIPTRIQGTIVFEAYGGDVNDDRLWDFIYDQKSCASYKKFNVHDSLIVEVRYTPYGV